jgi:hypothetical protein
MHTHLVWRAEEAAVELAVEFRQVRIFLTMT